MSYMTRPLGGVQQPVPTHQAIQQQQQQGGAGANPQQSNSAVAANMSMTASALKLGELLEYVRQECEALTGQAEGMRRENIEYASNADMHVQEIVTVRRELAELEREHTRSKTQYEEKISDLKRQLEHLRASHGHGPPVPTVIPATTNHFGSLMGHPLGMFGQAGPGSAAAAGGAGTPTATSAPAGPNSATPNGKSAVGGPSAASAMQNDRMQVDPSEREREQREREREHRERERLYLEREQRERERERMERDRENREREQREREMRERERERERSMAHTPQEGGQQQQHLGLGKRPRVMMEDHSPYGIDGQPPAIKSRTGDMGRPGLPGMAPAGLENGFESRTGSAAAFPPRPPSRTYGNSPHPGHRPASSHEERGGYPGRGTVGTPNPADRERERQQQLGQDNERDVKQHAAPIAKPASQTPQPQQSSTPQPPPHHQHKTKQPDWEVTYNSKVKKTLDVNLVHTFLHDSVVCCVRISPDGKMLATGCNRNTTLYDTESGELIAKLIDDSVGRTDNYIRSVAFSPDGRLIATGSEDRTIRIWTIASGSISRTLKGHTSEIYSLAFSPDGALLVSGSGDRTAKIWEVSSGRTVDTLAIDNTSGGGPDGAPPAADSGVTSVAISSDGKLLACGSLDYMIRIWDLSTGKFLDKLRGHKDSVYSVAFIPSSGASTKGEVAYHLLSGSLDKTLKVWDLTNLRRAMQEGKPIDPDVQKTHPIQSLTGHKDFVLSVTTSASGDFVVSGSKDRSVQFWDIKTGSPQFLLHGHKNSVISVAMSEVGGLLATGSGDWQARIFKINGLSAPAPPQPAPAPAIPASGSAPATNGGAASAAPSAPAPSVPVQASQQQPSSAAKETTTKPFHQQQQQQHQQRPMSAGSSASMTNNSAPPAPPAAPSPAPSQPTTTAPASAAAASIAAVASSETPGRASPVLSTSSNQGPQASTAAPPVERPPSTQPPAPTSQPPADVKPDVPNTAASNGASPPDSTNGRGSVPAAGSVKEGTPSSASASTPAQ